MKLTHAAITALAALSLISCGSSRGRTVELPGGGPSETEQAQQAQHAPRHRWFGRDERPNAGPCPLMGVLYDAARVVEFAAPNQERYSNISYTGEMQGVRGLCRYVDSNPITMSIAIDMSFGRGPAATSEHKIYRYWVAVARRGRAPIAKQYFDLDVSFPRGQAVVTRTEDVQHIEIPRADPDTSGENFEVLVGFDVTPAQLQFNRDGKRFRVDSGASPAPSPPAH